MNIFILLLLSHLLGDIVLPWHRITVMKRSESFWVQLSGHITHAFIHGFFAATLLFIFINDHIWLKAAALVFCTHLIIDVIRSNIEVKLYGAGTIKIKRMEFIAWITGRNRDSIKMSSKNLTIWLSINILDQLFHIISLYIISIVV